MARMAKTLQLRLTDDDVIILKRIMVEFKHANMSDAVRMVFNCSGVYTDVREKLKEERGEKANTKEPRK